MADVDLLTIKIRLLVASVDKAREIGMDWWENDSYYSSKGRLAEKEYALLTERINHLEQLVEQKALPDQVEKEAMQKALPDQVKEAMPEAMEDANQVEKEAMSKQMEEKALPQQVEELE